MGTLLPMSGPELRGWRAFWRVTQKSLAQELGVTPRAVRAVEARPQPRASTVRRYMEAVKRLGMS